MADAQAGHNRCAPLGVQPPRFFWRRFFF